MKVYLVELEGMNDAIYHEDFESRTDIIGLYSTREKAKEQIEYIYLRRMALSIDDHRHHYRCHSVSDSFEELGGFERTWFVECLDSCIADVLSWHYGLKIKEIELDTTFNRERL